MIKTITLDHGSGYGKTSELIESLFLKHFKRGSLSEQGDSVLLKAPEGEFHKGNIAFTTDSFVVKPIFFPGGNIGKLSVCGTVNDLCVSGARAKYLSCGFILEEGFPLDDLEKIVKSMAHTAEESGVQIVTGDTKVVEKGACDKIYINTSGVGFIEKKFLHISGGKRTSPGDVIIINGPVAEHGLAVLSLRNSFSNNIISDCAPLGAMIRECLDTGADIRFMRDATRGGVASVLSELAAKTNLGIELFEENIPITSEAAGLCEILGFDPLYVANEGKVIIVVPPEDCDKTLSALSKNKEGTESCVIGKITDSHLGDIVLNTLIGGRRYVDIPEGTQLPRIC